MNIVKRTTGKFSDAEPFHNQEFFADANWDRFQPGDIVWLEDYPGTDQRICGVFIGLDHDDAAVIRLIPNRDGAILARHDNIENITQLSDYWQRYLHLQGVVRQSLCLRPLEKNLSDTELKHWAIRCLKQVVDNLDKIDSKQWPTLKDKVFFKASEIGFKPGNCQKIADRAMAL